MQIHTKAHYNQIVKSQRQKVESWKQPGTAPLSWVVSGRKKGVPSLLASLTRNLVSSTWRWRGWQMLTACLSCWDTVSLDRVLRGVGAPYSWFHPPREALPSSWTPEAGGKEGSLLRFQCHKPSPVLVRVSWFSWLNISTLRQFTGTLNCCFYCCCLIVFASFACFSEKWVCGAPPCCHVEVELTNGLLF